MSAPGAPELLLLPTSVSHQSGGASTVYRGRLGRRVLMQKDSETMLWFSRLVDAVDTFGIFHLSISTHYIISMIPYNTRSPTPDDTMAERKQTTILQLFA